MSDDIIVRLKAVEAAEMDVANSCDLPPNLTANWEYAMAVRDGIAELAALRARVAELAPALEILEFHEGSAEVERPGAHPTVRINAEDFATALAAVRRAAGNESLQRTEDR